MRGPESRISMRYELGSWEGWTRRSRRRRRMAPPPLPEKWVAPNFDLPGPRRELAGIVKYIDQHLLNLSGLNKQQAGLPFEIQ